MVYGRYNQLVFMDVHGGYVMVYKPTFTSLFFPILSPFLVRSTSHDQNARPLATGLHSVQTTLLLAELATRRRITMGVGKSWHIPWHSLLDMFFWLVVLTVLKNMKVNGKDYATYYGQYKMFETTFSFGIYTHAPMFLEIDNVKIS